MKAMDTQAWPRHVIQSQVLGDRAGYNGNNGASRRHEPLFAQRAVVGLLCLAEIRYARHGDE